MLHDLLFPFEEFSRNVVALSLVAVLSAYLGVYVICKRIVFVGVALAEMAAFGIGLAFLLSGWAAAWGLAHWEEWGPLLLSLFSTLAGALFFSLRSRTRRLSRESLLGVAYCLGAGLAVLCIWQSAEGLETLKNLMTGDVLIVSTLEVQVLAAVAGGLLLFLWLFAKELLFCSFDPDMARSLGIPARLFEVLLYLAIGTAVATGMRVGGILLVFSLMVLPACSGLLLAESFGGAQCVAVAAALFACAGGTWLSVYGGDGLPLPPSIVACLGGLFLAALLVSGHETARRWLRRVVVLLGLLALALAGLALSNLLLGTRIANSSPWLQPPPTPNHDELAGLQAELSAAEPARRRAAVERLATWDDPHAVELLAGALTDRDAGVQRAAVLALGRRQSPLAVDALLRFADSQAVSGGALLDLAEALLAHHNPEGLHLLIHQLAESSSPPFFRIQALQRLQALSGRSFAADQLQAWQGWWERNHAQLRWDDARGRFLSEEN